MTKKNMPKLESIKPGQKIEIEIDGKKSLKMFVANLYKRKAVMAQEIYSNELTAALKAAEMGKKPWIEITTNLDEGKMVIQGCESLGITPEILVEVATVLGASGNKDGTKPGMFGVGFAAPLGISEVILLSSLPIETGEQYDRVFAGSMASKAFDAADLEHTGTRIQISLLPNVNMGELVTHLAKCARFAEIPTFLINERPLDDSLGELAKPGRQELVRDTHARYLQSVRERVLKEDDNSEILGGAILEVSGKNFEFSCIYHPGGDYTDHEEDEPHKVFTLNIPIGASISLPSEIKASILNVTDATKLKPTPDRERLDYAAQKRINAVLPGLINAELKKQNLKSLQDFVGTPHPRLYVHQDNSTMSLPWYDDTTQRLSNIMNRLCFVHVTGKYKFPNVAFFHEVTGEFLEGKKLPVIVIPQYVPSKVNTEKDRGDAIKHTPREKKQQAWFEKVAKKYDGHPIVSFPDDPNDGHGYEQLQSSGHAKCDLIFAAAEVPRDFGATKVK